MASKFLTTFFHQECEEIKARTTSLGEILTLMRFEGKASEGKNLRRACDVFDSFDKELVRHMALEDKVIFSFIEQHVPKFDSLIYLLRSEHQDISRHLKNFKKILSGLRKTKKAAHSQKMAELQESGTYLIYLLKNHIQAECDSLYYAVDRYLKKEEKEQLRSRIVAWFKKK